METQTLKYYLDDRAYPSHSNTNVHKFGSNKRTFGNHCRKSSYLEHLLDRTKRVFRHIGKYPKA